MQKFSILHEINDRSFLITLPCPSSLTLVLEKTYRSSHWKYSIKKDVLKNFAKIKRKHLCQNLFSIKLKVSSLLKRHSNTNVFPRVLQNVLEHCFHTSEQPLLDIASYFFRSSYWEVP